MINVDYVVCPICKQKMRKIDCRHIKKHGITKEQFIKIYPKQVLMCSDFINIIKKNTNGHTVSQETKDKISKKLIGITNVQRHGPKKALEIYEKKRFKHTLDAKLRISNFQKNHKKKPLSNKTKQKLRQANLGKTTSEETRKKISKAGKLVQKNAQNRSEVRLKKRLSTLKNMKNNGNKFPGYNKKTIPIFQEFDKLNNTKGIYATNPHEHQILGYSLDYINFDLKLIIEVDEKHHFEKSTGLLKEKDTKRQEEIQKFYPDFQFLRFRDNEIYEILEIKMEEFINV